MNQKCSKLQNCLLASLLAALLCTFTSRALGMAAPPAHLKLCEQWWTHRTYSLHVNSESSELWEKMNQQSQQLVTGENLLEMDQPKCKGMSGEHKNNTIWKVCGVFEGQTERPLARKAAKEGAEGSIRLGLNNKEPLCAPIQVSRTLHDQTNLKLPSIPKTWQQSCPTPLPWRSSWTSMTTYTR